MACLYTLGSASIRVTDAEMNSIEMLVWIEYIYSIVLLVEMIPQAASSTSSAKTI